MAMGFSKYVDEQGKSNLLWRPECLWQSHTNQPSANNQYSPLYPTSRPQPTLFPQAPTSPPSTFSLPTNYFTLPANQPSATNFNLINPLPIIAEVFVKPLLQPLTNIIGAPNVLVTAINQQSPKALDVFEYIFGRVTFYDRMLENGINQKLYDIRYSLLRK